MARSVGWLDGQLVACLLQRAGTDSMAGCLVQHQPAEQEVYFLLQIVVGNLYGLVFYE